MATAIPTLYKGAGPGTHWHATDPRLNGFTVGAMANTANRVIGHITNYSFPSAYLSFSTSYAVARSYALTGPLGVASALAPGYVYEIDLSAVSTVPTLVDPIAIISAGGSRAGAHGHNGAGALIGEIASGLATPSLAHQCGGGMLTPAVSSELRALIFAMRDAEVLINGNVIAGAVVNRHSVF